MLSICRWAMYGRGDEEEVRSREDDDLMKEKGEQHSFCQPRRPRNLWAFLIRSSVILPKAIVKRARANAESMQMLPPSIDFYAFMHSCK